MPPATTPTCVKWCSLTWSPSCGPSSGASSCASAPSSTSLLPRGRLPALPPPRMEVAAGSGGVTEGEIDIDHKWTQGRLPPSFWGWNRLQRGCNVRMKTKTVAFLSQFRTPHSSVQLFYCNQLVEKSSPCPSSLLCLGDEQHCDQRSLLTVVIHHPRLSSQTAMTRKRQNKKQIIYWYCCKPCTWFWWFVFCLFSFFNTLKYIYMLKANERYHWIWWTLHLPFAKFSFGRLCLLEHDDTSQCEFGDRIKICCNIETLIPKFVAWMFMFPLMSVLFVSGLVPLFKRLNSRLQVETTPASLPTLSNI